MRSRPRGVWGTFLWIALYRSATFTLPCDRVSYVAFLRLERWQPPSILQLSRLVAGTTSSVLRSNLLFLTYLSSRTLLSGTQLISDVKTAFNLGE